MQAPNQLTAPPLHRRRPGAATRVAGWTIGLVFCGGAAADALQGSNHLLCYGLSAARCDFATSECLVKKPFDLNLPDFVTIDVTGKRLATTEASGHQGETPIRTVERADGTILLQGVQNGRAFSWLITESSGEGTLTMSSPTAGLTVFTVCTPIEKLNGGRR